MVHFSHRYVTNEKTIALTLWTFVSKEMSLIFNMLSSFAIAKVHKWSVKPQRARRQSKPEPWKHQGEEKSDACQETGSVLWEEV